MPDVPATRSRKLYIMIKLCRNITQNNIMLGLLYAYTENMLGVTVFLVLFALEL